MTERTGQTDRLKELLKASAVLPILTLDNIAQALRVAEALLEGGLRVMEITLRTAPALQAIRAVRDWFPEMTIGAGSVLSARLLSEAHAHGAQFAVSPGLTEELRNAAVKGEIPLIGGVQTPSEVMAAREAGLQLLKWYPAEASGGIAVLTDLCRIFPEVAFVPTGKISQDQAGAYLQLSQVAAVGASWVTPRELIDNKDFAGIAEKARQAVALRSSR